MAEPSTPSGSGIADALRQYIDRYVDAVAGATEAPRERAGKIVGDLAKRGEGRAKDIQKAARELADRSARDRRDLMGLIQKEIRRQVEALGLARRTEVERLNKRVQQLEKSVRSGKKTAASKPKTQQKKSGR